MLNLTDEIRKEVKRILDTEGRIGAAMWLKSAFGFSLFQANEFIDRLKDPPVEYPYNNDPEIISALQPFAELAKEVLDIHRKSPDNQILYGFNNTVITIGNLRQLLTALAKAEGTK